MAEREISKQMVALIGQAPKTLYSMDSSQMRGVPKVQVAIFFSKYLLRVCATDSVAQSLCANVKTNKHLFTSIEHWPRA